jgi:hypothetical protein
MDEKSCYPVNTNSCYRLFMGVGVVLLQRVEEFLKKIEPMLNISIKTHSLQTHTVPMIFLLT